LYSTIQRLKAWKKTRGLPRQHFSHLIGEAAVPTGTEHDAEGLAQTADGVGQSGAHADQLPAGGQHGAQTMTLQALDLDRPVPVLRKQEHYRAPAPVRSMREPHHGISELPPSLRA
jgi:hypothetical protein